MRKRQVMGFTLTATVEGDADPEEYARNLLSAPGIEITDYWEVGCVEELPEVNRERLIKLAIWVAGEDAKRRLGLPNEWDQSHWLRQVGEERTGTACGTACCVAGRIVLEDGGKPNFWEGRHTSRVPDGTETHVEDYARQALGLSNSQASRLFEANNTLDDVLRIITDLLSSTTPPNTDEEN
jgi:hypothetical protein